MLFGVTPTDPLTYGGAALLVVAHRRGRVAGRRAPGQPRRAARRPPSGASRHVAAQVGQGREMTQALMPPTPSESLPARPCGAAQAWSQHEAAVQRLDRRVERARRQRRRIELAAREAEVLRGQLPAAAGAHAVPERPLARRAQHGGRQRRAQQLHLVVVAGRRGGVQIPGADVGGDRVRRRPAPARWRRCGPAIVGVMMWSASELTPTAIGSMPSTR